MMLPTPLVQRLRALYRSVLWRNPQQADTGRIDSSNNPLGNPTDGLEAGEIYVRVGGSRAETVALNGIVNDQMTNIPVIVGIGRFSKRLEIIDLDRERARKRFQSAISSLWAQPSGDLSRTTTRGRNFKPGRVRVSSLGGLVLCADPFFYKDSADALKLWEGEASGTLDVSGSEPSANNERWVVIALDPDATTPVLVAIDGTEQLLTLPGGLTLSDIADIAITDGYYPLAAVRYVEGATTFAEEEFVDFRLYFEKDGAVSGMTSFTVSGDSGSDQTITNGNTLEIAGGTGIDTVAGATDTLTVSIDNTVATLTGVQTLTNKTLTTPTIANFTNAQHDHQDADDGGTLSPLAIVCKGVRVHHNANQNLSDGVGAALALNSERFDTDAYHDTSTNNSRLTVPSGLDGLYLIFGNANFASNATGDRLIGIRLNGTTNLSNSRIPAATTGVKSLNTATVYSLVAGDYVELTAFQNSGGTLAVESTGNVSPEFGMIFLGKAA